MRKLLVILAAVVISLSLFTPAQAAKKSSKSSISLSPRPSGTQRTYNDTSLDLTSSSAPVNTRTTIRGKVKGGKGKKVAIYATNMHSQSKARHYLGSAKVNKKGYFTKKFAPKKGYAGTYKIDIVKKSGRKSTKSFYIRVYEFVSLARFYDAAASTGSVARADKEPVGPGVRDKWSVSYAIAGGSTAAFNFSGYRCIRFNLKVGVSLNSAAGSTSYAVGQPDRGLMASSKSKGGGFDEPSRRTSENVNPNLPFTVSNTGDPASRLILGLPKVACMMPYKVTAAAW